MNRSQIDERRQPITALAARGFWNGISELKNVLTPGNPLLENQGKNSNATFYVGDSAIKSSSRKSKVMDEEDQFFKDINTLYQRQKVLFQKCCEQLKDIYLVRIWIKSATLGLFINYLLQIGEWYATFCQGIIRRVKMCYTGKGVVCIIRKAHTRDDVECARPKRSLAQVWPKVSG